MAATKGLHSKLAEAIAEVEHVAKDGRNDHFKYAYTSAEEVYREVRGPLLKRGLIVIPSVSGGSTEGTLTTVQLHMRIIDSESGETLEAEWTGTGDDRADKGVFKAYTGGLKTFYRHLFMLPADDDPEADSETDKRAEKRSTGPLNGVASEKQRAFVARLLGDQKYSPEEKRAIDSWLKRGYNAWGKAACSQTIELLKDNPDGRALLLQEAGYDDLPADTEGLEHFEPAFDGDDGTL